MIWIIGYVVVGFVCGVIASRRNRGECDQGITAFVYFAFWPILAPIWLIGELFVMLGGKDKWRGGGMCPK